MVEGAYGYSKVVFWKKKNKEPPKTGNKIISYLQVPHAAITQLVNNASDVSPARK